MIIEDIAIGRLVSNMWRFGFHISAVLLFYHPTDSKLLHFGFRDTRQADFKDLDGNIPTLSHSPHFLPNFYAAAFRHLPKLSQLRAIDFFSLSMSTVSNILAVSCSTIACCRIGRRLGRPKCKGSVLWRWHHRRRLYWRCGWLSWWPVRVWFMCAGLDFQTRCSAIVLNYANLLFGVENWTLRVRQYACICTLRKRMRRCVPSSNGAYVKKRLLSAFISTWWRIDCTKPAVYFTYGWAVARQPHYV